MKSIREKGEIELVIKRNKAESRKKSKKKDQSEDNSEDENGSKGSKKAGESLKLPLINT